MAILGIVSDVDAGVTLRVPRIALVFDGLSLPPKDGVIHRVYNVAKALMERSDVDVRLYHGDRGWTSHDSIRAEGFKGWMFPANWLMEQPSKVADLIIADKIDIIHICNSHSILPFTGLDLAQRTGAKLVCDMHDIDHQLFQSLGKSEAEIDQARHEQTLIADYCDHVFAMSSTDIVQLKEMGIPLQKITHSPNGIDLFEGPVPADKVKRALFIGNMFYEPNRQAAELILKDIAPATALRHPDVEFVFIGRTPAELLHYRNQNVQILGEVDNLTPHLLSAAIGLAPLTSGSGMKVKMLTYASHSLPVLGTEIALMGYEKNDGFVIDNVKAFAVQLGDLLADPRELLRRGQAGRDYVKDNFQWSKICNGLADQYKKISYANQDRPNREILRQSKSVVVDGMYFPMPMYMSEKRFTEDMLVYSDAISLSAPTSFPLPRSNLTRKVAGPR